MGEMYAHIPEGPKHSRHPPQYLCLCPQPDPAACHATHAAQGRSALLDVASRSCALPLMTLCQEAHERKSASGRSQVLVLYEVEPAGLEAMESCQCDILPVSLCSLERIGHADLLHALAGGFDVIHMQLCTSPSGLQHQQQEVELVHVLGGKGRILLFGGEPVGVMLRVPDAGDHRANMHVGATVEACELSEHDRAICAAIGPHLQKWGMSFVGIDVIGRYLTEINVTSPTGIQEMNRLYGKKLESDLVDCVLQQLDAHRANHDAPPEAP